MSKGAFKNFKFKNLSFKNKVVMAPESSNRASIDGQPTEFHFNHYGSKAIDGVGTVVVEATAVEKRGRETTKDLGIWSDRHIKGLKKIARTIKSKEVIAGIQLFHSGKKGQAINLDADEIDNNKNLIKDFSENDIKMIIKAFKKAAKRALKAGFDFIEINGELISEFLCINKNKRKDNYGGNFKNRSRIVVEIVRAIRQVWPSDKVLAIRLSSELYGTKNVEREEFDKLIDLLRVEGVDLINISTQNEKEIEKATLNKIKSKKVSEEKSLPIVEGGLINVASESNDVKYTEGLAFLGQAILRDSYWIINEVKSFVSGKTYVKVI